MSHQCTREGYNNLPTAAEWLTRADAAVCAIVAARKALRQTTNDHGWTREGQATELKKRTDAYYGAVHHFLAVVRQGQEHHPRDLSAIQEKFEGLLEDVKSLFRSAAPGSEQACRSEEVLKQLESIESYIRNDQGMSMSTWSDSTAAGGSSPEHTRDPQSPQHKRNLSRRSTHEARETSPSPRSVSKHSVFDTLVHEFKQILTDPFLAAGSAESWSRRKPRRFRPSTAVAFMLRPRKPAQLGWISDGDVHEYMQSALANERME